MLTYASFDALHLFSFYPVNGAIAIHSIFMTTWNRLMANIIVCEQTLTSAKDE